MEPSSTPGPSGVALTSTPGPSGMALTSTPGPSGVVPNLSMEAVESDSDVDLPLVNVTKSEMESPEFNSRQRHFLYIFFI